jgi:hypothetical protein
MRIDSAWQGLLWILGLPAEGPAPRSESEAAPGLTEILKALTAFDMVATVEIGRDEEGLAILGALPVLPGYPPEEE